MNIAILAVGVDPLIAQNLYVFTTRPAIELISPC